MTPARTLLSAAVLLAAVAAAPVGAATHTCSSDVLAAARSGPVTAYFPSACYDAARSANSGGSSAVTARLQKARARDARRSLNAKITGNDTVRLGRTLQLRVTTTLEVRGLRVQLMRLGSGGLTPVSTSWLSGTTRLVAVHPTAKGTLRVRLNLGFVLNGKVIGGSTSPTLTLHVR